MRERLVEAFATATVHFALVFFTIMILNWSPYTAFMITSALGSLIFKSWLIYTALIFFFRR